ncbi:MAG TPA: hypothetical protein ENI23_09815 [bacterium]|nr:hypothetical protein [bacterium]
MYTIHSWCNHSKLLYCLIENFYIFFIWLQFVKAFRELMRIKNILQVFADFTFDDVNIEEQEYEDYKSKYLDIYDRVRNETEKEKVSILDDVDFELELIHRDEINVLYILRLLAQIKESSPDVQAKLRKNVADLLSGQPHLRSKKELIEQFIEENLPNVNGLQEIEDEFDKFWSEQTLKAFHKLSKDEGLDTKKLQKVIDDYVFTELKPLSEDVVALLKVEPKILERKSIIDTVTSKILSFVETFIEGI